jgi:FSR family fosmidomycin resistance protein-like MFS transporter
LDNSIFTNIEAEATQQPFAQQNDEDFHASKSALISSAHFINDLYTGFMSHMLPSLIAQFALLKVQASFFLFLYQGASILQPLIGNWADRVNLRKVALFARQ